MQTEKRIKELIKILEEEYNETIHEHLREAYNEQISLLEWVLEEDDSWEDYFL